VIGVVSAPCVRLLQYVAIRAKADIFISEKIMTQEAAVRESEMPAAVPIHIWMQDEDGFPLYMCRENHMDQFVAVAKDHVTDFPRNMLCNECFMLAMTQSLTATVDCRVLPGQSETSCAF
jgi:hypothetical protein